MFFEEVSRWNGAVQVNGILYPCITDAENSLKSDVVIQDVLLLRKEEKQNSGNFDEFSNTSEFVVTVKPYMTQKSTPGFDFMDKWNDNKPMPLRTMVGVVEKSTKGMVYMNLHGDIVTTQTQCCLKCGQPITHNVSRYFGLGPVCGKHNYIHPFDSEEELRAEVEKYRNEVLRKITWQGWIIKSAIINWEELK